MFEDEPAEIPKGEFEQIVESLNRITDERDKAIEALQDIQNKLSDLEYDIAMALNDIYRQEI